MNLFNEEVVEVLKKKYFEFLSTTEEESLRKDLQKFTVVVLLKMEHMSHIIFKTYSIAQVANLPQSEFTMDKMKTVRVYYELLDHLLFLPEKCIRFLNLKECAVYQLNNILKYIGSKYMMKRSVSGWTIYDYTLNSLKDLFSEANNMVWGSWTLFKNYYY